MALRPRACFRCKKQYTLVAYDCGCAALRCTPECPEDWIGDPRSNFGLDHLDLCTLQRAIDFGIAQPIQTELSFVKVK